MGENAIRTIAVLIGLVLSAPAFGASPDSYRCKSRSDLVGPCFTVHGRLRMYNGSPLARIWPIGTHRLLGVPDDLFYEFEHFVTPALRNEIGFNSDIYADFEVCPLTKSKPGVMQSVCISGAKHIRVDRLSDDRDASKATWVQLPDVSWQ